MAGLNEQSLAFLQEIVDRLRTVAVDEGEDLTPAERRELVEIALEVERRARRAEGGPAPTVPG